MAPPSTPDHPATPTTQNEQGMVELNALFFAKMFLFYTKIIFVIETDPSNNSNSASAPLPNTNSVPETNTNSDDEEGNAPCIVVYLVEPATGGDRRTSCLAMLRAASTLLNSLPENIKPNVFTQVCFYLVCY